MSFCGRTLCGSVAFGTSTCNMSTLACQQKKDFTYLSLTFIFFDKHLASRSAVKVPLFPGFKKETLAPSRFNSKLRWSSAQGSHLASPCILVMTSFACEFKSIYPTNKPSTFTEKYLHMKLSLRVTSSDVINSSSSNPFLGGFSQWFYIKVQVGQLLKNSENIWTVQAQVSNVIYLLEKAERFFQEG